MGRSTKKMEIESLVEEENHLTSFKCQTVAVAICGNKNSKLALKWALDKFIPEGRVVFKLLHVRPRITTVPTPMGNSVPLSKVRDDVVAAYKSEIEWQTNAMLLPFKQMCSKRQVEADAIIIEADVVTEAIAVEASKSSFTTLVIGGSSRNMLTRKFKGPGTSARISECIPTFCTVYVISKGRLSSVRPSTSDITPIKIGGRSEDGVSITSETSNTSSSQAGTSANSSNDHSYGRSSSLPMQRYQALLTTNHALLKRRSHSVLPHQSRHLLYSIEGDVETSTSSYSKLPSISSIGSDETNDDSLIFDQASSSNNLGDTSISSNEVDLNLEIERLRVKLKHIQGMCTMAQDEKRDASQEVVPIAFVEKALNHLNELNKRKMEETERLREVTLREQQAREVAILEKERNEVAQREAELVKERAKREILDRKEAEIKAAQNGNEMPKHEGSLLHIDQKYKKFSWEEITCATSSFSDAHKIGMGACGTVYKCKLIHTVAAVKILHQFEGKMKTQFQKELEILSSAHHPYLLLLLGACPEHGCLVYEYMENGSLEDRLLRKNGTPPIPWYCRYRIAWEIASALAYLHNSTPKPVIHRDLKPSNILLDQNLGSKVGDVGLSTLLPTDSSSVTTMFKDTTPVGTLCYIDPEYQRNGLVSPKSDLYAFGIVILQLLTAKPPMALAHIVETALEEGNLVSILDAEAGQWPLEETQDLALLGLNCTEMRRRDRPDLNSQVLPMLERLKDFAKRAEQVASTAVPAISPSHFICPILQDVMSDPCVAADGYTYDRSAIEIWFTKNDRSPVTNSTLPHKHLIPNYTLLSAITEWRARNT